MVNIKTVVNVKGSSARKPSSGSWSSKLNTCSSVCQIKSCNNTATAGMHVRPASSSSSNNQYIVRGCAKHNSVHNTSSMNIKQGASVCRAKK